MILDILAILVGLLAIAQFFIKDIAKWNKVSKIVTFLLLAIISILLVLCSRCKGTEVDEPPVAPTITITTKPEGNSTPTPEPIQTSATAPAKLSECRLCDANIVDYYAADVSDSSYMKDSFGNKYRQEVVFDRNYENDFIIFSPLGEFTRFSGTVAVSEDSSGRFPYNIEIFADNVSIYYSTIEKTDEPVQFDLDITDARLIKIAADGGIIIGDGVFYN